eukprot:CAMPEP_0197244746 /NCGR_PEP_ID=MMETSP1429-20130617/9772_1 /TAXON_ID=49237 /ORGANISM="Chaetoceros  sp., Strain UNC1202" /LENGTH=110 /DNA_ID=CAMNT_0042705153 /DNA_START=91 /DNA_END=423 /DNA_ORIENTATION=+
MPIELEEHMSVDEFAALMHDVNQIVKRHNAFTVPIWLLMSVTCCIGSCPMKRRIQMNEVEVNEFLMASELLKPISLTAKYYPPDGRRYGFIEFVQANLDDTELDIEMVDA